MAGGRSDNPDGEGGEDTPPTRSYVDALLRGNLSADQVASLRAEIATRAEEEAAQLPRSYPPGPSGAPSTPPPSSPPLSPRVAPRTPLPSSSRPRVPTAPPSKPPASWPSLRFPNSSPPPE